MKKVALVALFAVLLVGVAFAQQERPVLPVHQTNSYDAGGQQSRIGAQIWANNATSGWFNPWDDEYVNLDWGFLADQGTGTVAEVVNGFSFGYATDNQGNTVDWAMWFFDSCTGWNDPFLAVCAGFGVTGLPGGITGPGTYWGWLVTLNIEGSGYEFLMGQRIGVGHEKTLAPNDTYTGGLMTLPPGLGGNGPVGTEDAFDILYPLSTGFPNYYVVNPGGNSWWFGGYPPIYASFVSELFGPQVAGGQMAYAGDGTGGNDVGSFACIGNWAPGGAVTWLAKQITDPAAQTDGDGKLHANFTSYGPNGLYLAGFDLTIFPTYPPVVPFIDMVDFGLGWDLEVYTQDPLGAYATPPTKLYSQGVFIIGPGAYEATNNAVIHN
jgi:hypothetical protein